MSRTSASVLLAGILLIGVSCNGSSGSTDGGGGSTGGSGGHTGGAGGATGGTGGHGTGGQGGIDNLCLSEGQSCGTPGPLCCSGLMCCYGSNDQASCVPGSCTGSQGGHGGGGAAGGGSGGAAGNAAGGASGGSSGVGGKAAGGASGGGGGSAGKGGVGGTGGAGGAQMYSCGSDTCTVGESFCYSYTPGTAGPSGRSCQPTPAACASTPTSCACLCPPSSNTGLGCVPVGMGAGNFCSCTETGGVVTVSCAGS